ncbi:MAG: histidine kinase dimerization/phospho-acceptor domain-containing protein [Eggerthellaceae bacterium]
MRANLLRTISHDLRTPLTSISGDADMLCTIAARCRRSRRSTCTATFTTTRAGWSRSWRTCCPSRVSTTARCSWPNSPSWWRMS